MPCCVCQVRFHHSAAAPRADNVQSPSARAVTITCAGGISSFSRVPCNDLVIKPSWVGRTGEVPCNDSALHRLIEIHQPKRAKASPRSAASARYECAVQLARPNCEFAAGGEGKGLLLTISSLAIAAPADWHLRGTAVLPLHCKYTERSDVSAIRNCSRAVLGCNCRILPAIAGTPAAIVEARLQFEFANALCRHPAQRGRCIVHTSWMQGGA